MTTLADIRFIVEQNIKDQLDPQDIINWCNDAQSNFGLAINIPGTAQITLDPATLKYQLPADLKQINRLWLQSDFDNGMDREFNGSYRIYSGYLIFPRAYPQADTLNVDYYKNMKYFAAVTDAVDLDQQFTPLYTAYVRMRYYMLPAIKERLGNQAGDMQQTYSGMYEAEKRDVISYYSLKTTPYVVQERW